MNRAAVAFRLLRTQDTPEGVLLASTDTGTSCVTTFLSGASAEALAGKAGSIKQIGGGFLLVGRSGEFVGEPHENAIFEGRDVVFGMRNAETPEAVAEWLTWHAAQGATGALIFDRGPPDEARSFSVSLGRLVQGNDPDRAIFVVGCDRPMGAEGAPDARNPRILSAPAAGKDAAGDVPVSAWHANFAETILLETLRHRWLARARSAVFLDACDLLLPFSDGVSVFDRAAAAAGRPIVLEGREHYPWSLRESRAAFVDHIYRRIGDKRWVSRWAISPVASPESAVWRMVRIGGVRAATTGEGRFLRAMGVAFPDAGPGQLVDLSELVEDASVAPGLGALFRRAPLRRPVPALPALTGGGVTVVTAMKNEGPYILDWIAHHRAVGVDRFLVYTNDCDDGTERLLDALGQSGAVIRRDNPFRALGNVPQHAAFRAAEAEDAVRGADWLLTLDVDEYLNIHAGDGRISDLLNAVPDANVISMPWRLFGNADVVGLEDCPVTAQFTACAPLHAPRPHQAWGFKTLYRNAGLFRRLGVHRPRGLKPRALGLVRWVCGDGRPMPPEMWPNAWRMTERTWGYDLVTVNHYALRSAEAFLIKRERGRVNHTERSQGAAYWFRMNHNAETDVSIQRLGQAAEREKAALLALPGVKEAHEAAFAWHQARASELRQDPDYAALFEAITGDRLRRLSRMLRHFGGNVFLAGPSTIPDDVVARDPEGDWTFTIPSARRVD